MVAEKLLDSCQELYNNTTITRKQYIKCKNTMDDGKYTLNQERLTETNIFGSPRDIKESKLEAFLANIKIVKDKTLEKYKEKAADAGADAAALKPYTDITTNLKELMTAVIDWIQELSVEQHKNTEDSHYKQLVEYYTKIDNNRKELDKIQKQFNTLEQKSTHQDITKNDKSSGYMTQRNIMISLIIFLIICVVIIFLLYFI
tara:strand:+ start:592 stop:1197 length:606 start_codon:yes stop_codon:yes gene_type:complete